MSNETSIEELGLSSKTLTNWNMFCREVYVEMCGEETEILGEPGMTIDESKFLDGIW